MKEVENILMMVVLHYFDQQYCFDNFKVQIFNDKAEVDFNFTFYLNYIF